MGGCKVAQKPQHKDGRYDEEGACHDATQRPVQAPANISRDLLGLRSGKEHAEVQGPQVLFLRNPALVFDQFTVHDRDLSGGTPEVDKPKLYPEPKRLPETNGLGFGLRTTFDSFSLHVHLLY